MLRRARPRRSPRTPAVLAAAGLATALAGALAVALVVEGCSGCRGPGAGPPPERFLPGAPDAALVVPDLGRAVRELAALAGTAATFPGVTGLAGGGDASSLRAALVSQLGFDPLDPAALEEAGFEPRGGAAVARWQKPAPVGPGRAAPGPASHDVLLVLPVRDAGKVEALLGRLARDRLGAPDRTAAVPPETRPGQGVQVFTLRRAPAEPPVLAYAVVDGATLLLAPGAGGPAAVAEAAARARSVTGGASLQSSAPFAATRRALGDLPAALAWAPPGSPLLEGIAPLRDGLALGVAASATRLVATAAVPLGAREPGFAALAPSGPAGGPVPGKKRLERLAPGAPLAFRWDGPPGPLASKLLPALPPPARAALAGRGAAARDALLELLDVVRPGAAAVVTLSPRLDLASLDEAAVREDPLRILAFEATAEVTDASRARVALERIFAPPPPPARPPRPPPGRAPAAPIAARPPPPAGDAPASLRLATSSGEVAARLDGTRLAVAGGPPGALDALVARLDGAGPGYRAPTPDAADALSDGLGAAVLDAQALVASVRALPDEAFGTGPTGFVVRSVVNRFLEPAGRLAAVSLQVSLAPGALVVGLEVEARTGAGGTGGAP